MYIERFSVTTQEVEEMLEKINSHPMTKVKVALHSSGDLHAIVKKGTPFGITLSQSINDCFDQACVIYRFLIEQGF